ncbi:undecaprenyl/decaprenyl-phosphate alpha-N-acetylglucosaminyl 1-phosphate transferase [Wenzhouxiangella sp. AB-CW3]|uniref:MraY family glycosyltransferase n=1 Tax=Wenzhouxiangella sp. AB-CW3 TaxID=2771012 RepID=UPI00168B30A3|nr:MraY family glycosyltransferase [Wenzhouxiangella sp. AB-CW3]QOC23810.1 undecaprenyl/decaprenyl-phosphate alpha-N-acetylglucosaminyl 1-phosphate transferase [Wenzhouxiangella sp. AB-CW3]
MEGVSVQGLLAIVAGFVFVSILIPMLCRPAERLGLLDLPDDRKLHGEPVPMIGGIAMFIAFCAAILIVDDPLRPYASLVIGMGVLLATGLVDDALDITPASKLIMQLVAATLMVAWGEVQIHSLGNLLGEGEVELGEWAIPFTVLCTVFMINAINMADGTDGLAGGLAVLILVALALLGWMNGAREAFVVLTAVLAAVTLGFLLFNMRTPWRSKASVFMGDAGSMMLGFAIAWLAVFVSQRDGATVYPVAIAWLLVLPVTDLVSSFFRRLVRGQSPFSADSEHLHHALLRAGVPVGGIVAGMLTLQVLFAGVGILGWWQGWSELWLAVGVGGVFLAHYLLSMRAWTLMKWVKRCGPGGDRQ